MAAKAEAELLEVAGREVRVSSPSKIYFPEAGITKLDLVKYYLAVGEGALRAIRDRPIRRRPAPAARKEGSRAAFTIHHVKKGHHVEKGIGHERG